MTDKPALRAHLRAARAAAGPVAIPAHPDFLARLRSDLVVAAYVPVGGEADPVALVEAARHAGCRLALPHVVDRATPLRFLAWDPDVVLAAGPFNLTQPAAYAEELAPDVILTPLVGFDRSGNRVGQGAGHYDRAFAAHPAAWRVGVASSVQEVARLTPDPWDVPLHAVVTEKEWMWTTTT